MHEHSIASHSKLWLMHAKVFNRESQTNNEHTVAVLYQKHDFILLHHFYDVFCFLIRNLIHFFSSFYSCNWPKTSHHHVIPGTTLIKNGSFFPPPRLFRAPRLFGREEYMFYSEFMIDLFAR